jgi:hypothetical protein
MTADAPCDETCDLLPELALGIADGADRARILARVAECADCRRELERQAATADSLLLLAPEHEPPAGFELAVLREIEPPPRQTASHDPAATRLRRSRRGRGRDHGGGCCSASATIAGSPRGGGARGAHRA